MKRIDLGQVPVTATERPNILPRARVRACLSGPCLALRAETKADQPTQLPSTFGHSFLYSERSTDLQDPPLRSGEKLIRSCVRSPRFASLCLPALCDFWAALSAATFLEL